MTGRLGRADLHIHTLASDGTAGVVEILDHVERNTELDVIAITDHERIDAALAGRAMARDRGLSFEVVVGEEVTTLGGHLLALWIETAVKPFRSLRSTIAAIHDQGGIAIPAHPLVPYPLCAQGFVLRRLLADEPRYRPDAIEAFNPTTLGRPMHARVVRFAEEYGLARIGSSDAHALDAIGSGYTTFQGHDGEHLRAAIAAATTHHHGTFHATGAQLGTFREQLRKYSRDARDNIGGRLRGDGSRRDLGYPRDGGELSGHRATLLAERRPATGDEVRGAGRAAGRAAGDVAS
jgi:predicted metal-dependent phosphoesterase TrpH